MIFDKRKQCSLSLIHIDPLNVLNFRIKITPFTISEPLSLNEGIRELQTLAKSVQESEKSSSSRSSSDALVHVFLETCLLAQRSNKSIVDQVKRSIATGDNATKVLHALLSQNAEIESQNDEIENQNAEIDGQRTRMPRLRARMLRARIL